MKKQIILLFLALSLTCCSSPVVQNENKPIESNPCYFQATDGTYLYYKETPSLVSNKGIILIIQGSGGGLPEDYSVFMNQMSSNGFTSIRTDERGTGYSQGWRGDIKDFNLILQDYREMILYFSDKFSKPIYLLGHSFGGVLVTRLSEELDPYISGVILINPAYHFRKDFSPNGLQKMGYILKMIFSYKSPVIDLSGSPDRITFLPDKQEALRRGKSPNVVQKFSMRYLMGTTSTSKHSEAYAISNSNPILLILGEKDGFIDQTYSVKLVEKWNNTNKNIVVIENAGHGVYITEMIAPIVTNWLNDLFLN